jgi:hypothetical protein
MKSAQRPWLLGQKVSIAPDRVEITIDFRVRLALLLGMVPGAAAIWWGAVHASLGVAVLGVIPVLLSMQVAARTPWRTPSSIVVTAAGIALGTRTIPAREITEVVKLETLIPSQNGRSSHAAPMMWWRLLVVSSCDDHEDFSLGARGLFVSTEPLDALVAAINGVLGQAARYSRARLAHSLSPSRAR